MRRLILVSTLSASLVLALIIGVAFAVAKSSDGTIERQFISVSKVADFDTVADMKQESSLIIQGTIMEVQPTYLVHGTPFTDFLVRVDRILFSRNIGQPKTLVVNQDGGIIGERRVAEIEHNPLFKKGEQHILFLYNWSLFPEKYRTVGIDNGRYQIINWQPTHLYDAHPLSKAIKGKSLEEFIAEIEAASASQAK